MSSDGIVADTSVFFFIYAWQTVLELACIYAFISPELEPAIFI
jgi:hypothetical protein